MIDLFEKVEDQVKKLKQGFMQKVFGGEPSESQWALARTVDGHFDEMVAADPSQQKKYLSWMIRLYLTGKLKVEDLYKVTEYLDVLNRGKVKGVDVNRFKSLPELFTAVEPFLEKLTQGQIDQKQRMKIDKETRLIYHGPEGRILSPETEESSQFWGRGTQWCTAAKNNCLFSHYNDVGSLYIIMPEDGRKFQFHPGSLQLMDEKDDEVYPDKFLETYPWVKEHIEFSKEDIERILEGLPLTSRYLSWIPPLDDETYDSFIRRYPNTIVILPHLTVERMHKGVEAAINLAKKNITNSTDLAQVPYYNPDSLEDILRWGINSYKQNVPPDKQEDFLFPEDLQLEIIKTLPKAITAYQSSMIPSPSENVMMAALDGDPKTIEYMHYFTKNDKPLFMKMRKFALEKDPNIYFMISYTGDEEKAIALQSCLRKDHDREWFKRVFWNIIKEIPYARLVKFFDDAIQEGYFTKEELPDNLRNRLDILKRKTGNLGEMIEQHKIIERFLDQAPEIDLPLHKGRRNQVKVDPEVLVSEIKQFMKKKGWIHLGTGGSASVFEHPGKDLVLKVIHTSDDGFRKFWTLCKKSENPHLLTVTRYGRFTFPLHSGPHTVEVVQMERLDYDGIGWSDKDAISLVVASGRYLRGALSKSHPIMKEITARYPEWIPALDMIKPLRSDKIFVDLHSNNVMFRGNVPVITDPLTE